MANPAVVEIVFPAGRWVGGSGAKGRQKEDKKSVKQFNADGSAVMDYSYGCAIAKTPGVDWRNEPWGQQVMAVAQRDFPQGQPQQATFSWKITDGDSRVPNKKQKVPADNPNYVGHWIVWFSSQFAPHTVNKTGSAPIAPETLEPGCFIQVVGGVRGNGSVESPGVYMNHVHVAWNNYGEPIHFESDASSYGLGSGPDPVGASANPLGGIVSAAQVHPAPSVPVASVAAAPAAPPAPPAPIPTVPHTAPLDVPPPTGPRYVLGAAAIEKGAKTVEDVLAWPGWSLEIALQHSYVIAA